MSIARQLAERIAALRYEDLPAAAIEWGKVAVLDTIGVTLAGAVEDAPRIVEDILDLHAGSGPSLVFGTRRRAGCLDAALINGTAAHALDFDNATNTMFGHASATMLPALIAAAEAHGGSGREVLVAHAAGFETGARLGRGLNMQHYEQGWHPTSTLGVFAVAAACAHLLKLPASQIETALALSTSLAAGIKANFGTMTKPLHVGQCARSGLMAALLARKGFTANPDAFEHQQGFFKVFNGPDQYDASRIMEGWGEPFDIVTPGACYKQYPCCASTHAAVDATLDLVRGHGPFEPGAIARIDTWTSAQRLAHTNRPLPESALDAKFSVQYCVARALLHGKVVFEHLEGDAYRDPQVRGLLPRIHAAPYAEGQFAAGNHVGAEIKISLADGRAFSARVECPLGRTSQNPISPEAMQAKFDDCAARVLAPQAITAVSIMIGAFEEVAAIRDFTALLEPAQSAADSGGARSANPEKSPRSSAAPRGAGRR